jgi:hypothetical protein
LILSCQESSGRQLNAGTEPRGIPDLLLDPDLEKVAVQSRQRLVEEFAEKHATLGERARRVPVNSARSISDEYQCPLQIATVAYLLDMDGIISIRKAIHLLSAELFRREKNGDGVPNLPGNVQEFAVDEARWISYIYGSFSREFEVKVRELANLESVVEDENPPVEKAISLMNARIKVVETFLMPVVQAWFKDHDKGTSEDLLVFLVPAVTSWNETTIRGKLIRMRQRNQALFRRLSMIIASASDSMTMDMYLDRVNSLIAELQDDTEELSPRAVSHLILHMAPRPTGARGDRSRFVEVGMASTRGNKAEPDMVSPFDFLERDILLARRRSGNEREEYLKQRIARVIRVLKYQGNDTINCIEQLVREITERFQLANIVVTDELERMGKSISNASQEEYDFVAMNLVNSFIEDHVFSR